MKHTNLHSCLNMKDICDMFDFYYEWGCNDGVSKPQTTTAVHMSTVNNFPRIYKIILLGVEGQLHKYIQLLLHLNIGVYTICIMGVFGWREYQTSQQTRPREMGLC